MKADITESPPFVQEVEIVRDQFKFKNEAATALLRANDKYSKFIEFGRQNGAYLDKIEYPAAFGPKGELLGIAVSCDIAVGETIMSIPSSFRIDITTIMASEIGPCIKEVLSVGDSEEMDEELVMALYCMHECKKGEMSRLYHSF